jgi:hypothetical protein
VPQYERFDVGFCLRRHAVDAGTVCVEFVVNEGALGHVFLEYNGFFKSIIIPPMLHLSVISKR